jgi:glc operon protein GlcG
MLQTPTLSHADALKALDAIRQVLDAQKLGAAVAIVDAHGELIAFLRSDGCPYSSINNALNKAYTAARERKESALVGQAARDGNFPVTNFGDLRYTGWGGGVPILYNGEVVGAVGVSGLPESTDIDLARLGAQFASA